METHNKQKEVGFAIHGLRAHIKALELNKGVRVSEAEYRYEIAQDRTSARIVLSADLTEVEGTKKPLADWAQAGKQARLGLIGLKATKESLHEKGENVQFTLNVIAGEAFLSRNGSRLTDQPQTIDEWAKIGRAKEKELFESLNAAKEYGSADAAEQVRAEMVRLGVIRERRTVGGEAEAPTN